MDGDGKASVTAVAAGVVDNLKNQPALLVILCLNVLMIGFLFWAITSIATGRTEMINKLIERCGTG